MTDEFITIRASELRGLRDELYSARYTIIELMSDEVAALLKSYSNCESTRDFHKWCAGTADKLASMVPPECIRQSYSETRAKCPLCGSVGHGPFANGFVLPEGMRRHFTGYGKARHCPVTEAAFGLGRDYVKWRYGEAEAQAEAAARAEEDRKFKQRRLVETLYKLDPFEEPKLVDETWLWSNEARDAGQLVWAEERLRRLGFSVRTEDRVKTISLDATEYVVFADHRLCKRIDFAVFRKPLKKGRRVQKGSFFLQDAWKNDLSGKFEKALQEQLRHLGIGARPDRPTAS